MIDTNEIRQKSVRAMLILHTLSDEDENWSVEEQLTTVNSLLHEIYTIATDAKTD